VCVKIILCIIENGTQLSVVGTAEVSIIIGYKCKIIDIFFQMPSQMEQNNLAKKVREMRNSAREPEPLFIICIRRLVELETHLGNTFDQLRTYEN
jgi:hypothetical protein